MVNILEMFDGQISLKEILSLDINVLNDLVNSRIELLEERRKLEEEERKKLSLENK